MNLAERRAVATDWAALRAIRADRIEEATKRKKEITELLPTAKREKILGLGDPERLIQLQTELEGLNQEIGELRGEVQTIDQEIIKGRKAQAYLDQTESMETIEASRLSLIEDTKAVDEAIAILARALPASYAAGARLASLIRTDRANRMFGIGGLRERLCGALGPAMMIDPAKGKDGGHFVDISYSSVVAAKPLADQIQSLLDDVVPLHATEDGAKAAAARRAAAGESTTIWPRLCGGFVLVNESDVFEAREAAELAVNNGWKTNRVLSAQPHGGLWIVVDSVLAGLMEPT